jgi:hypothetical protein
MMGKKQKPWVFGLLVAIRLICCQSTALLYMLPLLGEGGYMYRTTGKLRLRSVPFIKQCWQKTAICSLPAVLSFISDKIIAWLELGYGLRYRGVGPCQLIVLSNFPSMTRPEFGFVFL